MSMAMVGTFTVIAWAFSSGSTGRTQGGDFHLATSGDLDPPKRWVRTLVETEIAARDASNIRNRLKTTSFPVAKTLESFDVAASSIQPKVFDSTYRRWMAKATTQTGNHRTRRDR
jgi:hypothetical protein